MPELPEVETIRRDLEACILGKKITNVEIKEASVLKNDTAFFVSTFVGKSFFKMERLGKILVFKIQDSPLAMLIHLKMTGRVIITKKQITNPYDQGEMLGKFVHQPAWQKYIHVIWHFENGNLLFSDVRKFGYVKLVNQSELENEKKKFGFNPVDEKFTFEKFSSLFLKRKVGLKSFLLNQKYLAGIGNIYADEICFACGLHPKRHLNTLKPEDMKNLYVHTRAILMDAIQKRGTSFRDYVGANGKRGSYIASLKIYQRDGQPCPRCSSLIEKMTVASRGTHVCPKCQL